MKILSLNLCTSWTSPRRTRLEAVADFVRGAGVDLLLVQEGVRSCFVYDTIRQLARELDFEYFAKSTYGWPFFWESRVGILSRFKIIRTASLSCEVPQTQWVDAIPLPWRKRAVSVTVDVPGLGIMTAISVHLTSNPKTEADRARQLAEVNAWKAALPERDLTVYGGDFNAAFDRWPKETSYGFAPDYIFIEGAGKIIEGRPVLTDGVVTDHYGGVLVEVAR